MRLPPTAWSAKSKWRLANEGNPHQRNGTQGGRGGRETRPEQEPERPSHPHRCEWVQPVIVGENLTLWLDEEGRLKLPKPGFRLSGIAIGFVGNGVLLGGDADRARSCRFPAEIVEMGVR